ncbi:uncharacterized protein spaw [Drosophila kikkawai]|uniref:Uncharacterized protein spaw n=1 Tax=Drosophila kikkawai TaxID=30033 RepID=A0A6P4HML4_DROKI|nr:uncharacterized protein LOC108070843 [Drosophila kikkawai]
MSRLLVVRNLTRGIFRSGRLALGCRAVVRCLSDDSDWSSKQVQNKLKWVEMEQPSGQTSNRLARSEVKPKDIQCSEFNEKTEDSFTATWDLRNNELDVEQLAGLSGPGEVDDPYMSAEHEQEASEKEEHIKFQEELQFGRMLALREQLNRELCSSESFTTEERNSLASVKENVDFMMQELSQISCLLKTLQDNAPDTMSQEDYVMGKPYSSWEYTHPRLNSSKVDADVSLREVKKEKLRESPDSESPVIISDQETASSVDTHSSLNPNTVDGNAFYEEVMELKESQEHSEVPVKTTEAGEVPKGEQFNPDQEMAADDSPKATPAKPSESTPNPNTDGRQNPQTQETIHTYRPFRTIDVPVPKPSQSSQVDAVGSAENSATKDGYTICAQLPESESRLLMYMALKQALSDLESGRTSYKATVLMAKDENQGVD